MEEGSSRRRPMGLPDRRKNTYEELEKRLDHHLEIIEDRFERWFRRGLIAFAVMALCCFAALFGFAINLHEIKSNRELFVREACEQTNGRHDQTLARFEEAAAEGKRKHPELAQEIEESRDSNIGIIEALAPHQDCDYLVKLSKGQIKPTPTPKPKGAP